jgi:hypothetical protein
LEDRVGLANDLAGALSAFSGAVVAQNSSQEVPKDVIPVTQSNLINEGLLGLAYDVGTAPVSYAKGPTKIATTQALNSFQSEPETAD